LLSVRRVRARHGDDFLQDADFALGGMVGGFAAILRVGRQGDGSGARSRPASRPLPQLFGEERHGGMQQAQHVLESRQDIAPSGGEAGVFLEAQLLQLHVPIAEFVPDELPEHLRGFVIAIGLDGAVHLLAQSLRRLKIQRSSMGTPSPGSGFGGIPPGVRAPTAPRRSAPYS
jgi:hypothetical protein